MRHLHFCLVGNEVCFQGSVRTRHTLLSVGPFSHKPTLSADAAGQKV